MGCADSVRVYRYPLTICLVGRVAGRVVGRVAGRRPEKAAQ